MLRLSKTRWLALSPLLDEVLDLSPDERPAWLSALRESAPADAADLATLLVASERTDGMFGAASITAGDGEEPPGSWLGRSLGPWQLDSVLGRGGMATVYRANRVDGRFEGEAAIKVLHSARHRRGGDVWMRHEAGALARLSHPDIARLYDAGLTSEGYPYLVLELVDGEPIDQWCDRTRATVGTRLRLIRSVCDAVAHAHERLVVHRDLKPSNILVTSTGSVKLLDFGIAEMLDASERSPSGDAAQAFTPAYASPEQLRGEPISTATDVYAVGVLLHVLLCGRHPTAPPDATLLALLHGIEHTVPSHLDERIRRDPDRTVLAYRRGTSVDRLVAAVAGDLDVIARRALHKDPSMRYRTVAALGDDLARAARWEPVLARELTPWYRASRFVRRHRVGVVATGLVFGLLSAATIVTTAQGIEARRQRDAARFEARRSAASSEMLGAVLTDLGSGPAVVDSITARLSDVLLRQYQGDPRIHGRLLLELVGLLYGLDRRAATEQAVRAVQGVAHTAGDPELRASVTCTRAFLAALADSAMAARALLDSATRQLSPTDSVSGPAVQCQLARANVALSGDHDMRGAEAAAQRAIRWLRATGDSTSARYQQALTAVELALRFDRTRRREWLGIARELRRIAAATGRERSRFALRAAANEADALYALGEINAADSVVRTAIASLGAIRPVDVPWDLAKLRGELGFYREASDTALLWVRAAIQRAMADSSPRLAEAAMNRLPEVLLRLGRVGEARAAVEEYRAMARLSGRSNATMIALVEARLWSGLGEAERAWRRLDSLVRAHGWPSDYRAAAPNMELSWLVDLSVQTRRYALADSVARDVLDLFLASDSLAATRSAWVGRTYGRMAESALRQGDSVRARALAAQAMVPLRSALGSSHSWTRAVATLLAPDPRGAP